MAKETAKEKLIYSGRIPCTKWQTLLSRVRTRDHPQHAGECIDELGIVAGYDSGAPVGCAVMAFLYYKMDAAKRRTAGSRQLHGNQAVHPDRW